ELLWRAVEDEFIAAFATLRDGVGIQVDSKRNMAAAAQFVDRPAERTSKLQEDWILLFRVIPHRQVDRHLSAMGDLVRRIVSFYIVIVHRVLSVFGGVVLLQLGFRWDFESDISA